MDRSHSDQHEMVPHCGFDLRFSDQGTLKSLLQHHSSKASILQCSAFFMVQLTFIHDYCKNHIFDQMDLCWQNNVSVFFNMLSRLVIAFLPRSKWLNFMAAVTICSDFGAPKIKSLTVSIVSPSICREVMGPEVMGQSAWRTMDGGLRHCTLGSDQDRPQEKEMQKGKMVVWGGLTNVLSYCLSDPQGSVAPRLSPRSPWEKPGPPPGWTKPDDSPWNIQRL